MIITLLHAQCAHCRAADTYTHITHPPPSLLFISNRFKLLHEHFVMCMIEAASAAGTSQTNTTNCSSVVRANRQWQIGGHNKKANWNEQQKKNPNAKWKWKWKVKKGLCTLSNGTVMWCAVCVCVRPCMGVETAFVNIQTRHFPFLATYIHYTRTRITFVPAIVPVCLLRFAQSINYIV